MRKPQAKAPVEEVVKVVPTRLWVGTSGGQLEIKLLASEATNPHRVVGTLVITETGLRWLKSNAKVRPEREISFLVLERLQAAGIL